MSLMKFVAAGLLAGVSVSAQAAVMPLEQAAEKFGARPSAWGAELSPLGKQIVYLSAGAGTVTAVNIYDVERKTTRSILSSAGDPERLNWCKFVSEARLVCQFGGVEDWQGEPVPFSRFISIDTNGQDGKTLGVKSRGTDEYLYTGDGAIVDWLVDGDGEILMARHYTPEAYRLNTRIVNDDEGLGLDRLNVATLKSRTVEHPINGLSFYRTDGRGNVRIRAFTEVKQDQYTGVTQFDYRKAGSKDWEKLGSYNELTREGMWPLGVDADSDSLYFLKRHIGRDALFRMKLDGSGATEMVATNSKVDIGGIVRTDRGRRIVGYHYEDEKPRVVYFDAGTTGLSKALSKAMPGRPTIEFMSETRDGNRLLMLGSSDTDPGLFYLFNKQQKTLDPIFAARAALEGATLAPVKAITYKSGDGAIIPAYLTMSADGPQEKRPAVVLPHGGPSTRDSWGFDWLAQFLAARGYAVIQPNYRGSDGYGDEFYGENAFRDWRTAMADIAAAADYLASSGIADAERIAVVGWSYGGYAALQSAVLDPDQYQAVVAIAPVTDIQQLKIDANLSASRRVVREFVGGTDNAIQGSPLRHAGKIRAPVLLVHGDRDINVPKEHSLRMESALKAAGIPVQLLRYERLDHQLDDSNARTEILTKIGQLLDRTIGK